MTDVPPARRRHVGGGRFDRRDVVPGWDCRAHPPAPRIPSCVNERRARSACCLTPASTPPAIPGEAGPTADFDGRLDRGAVRFGDVERSTWTKPVPYHSRRRGTEPRTAARPSPARRLSPATSSVRSRPATRGRRSAAADRAPSRKPITVSCALSSLDRRVTTVAVKSLGHPLFEMTSASSEKSTSRTAPPTGWPYRRPRRTVWSRNCASRSLRSSAAAAVVARSLKRSTFRMTPWDR